MHLADRRGRDRLVVELDEQLVDRPAEFGFDRGAGELGRHRRCIRLELCEREPQRFGEAVVEVAGHLAELHQRALHLSEFLGDLFARCGTPAHDRASRGVRPMRRSCGRRSWRRCRRRGRPSVPGERCGPNHEVPSRPPASRDCEQRDAESDAARRGRVRPRRDVIASRFIASSLRPRRSPGRARARTGRLRSTTAPWSPSTRYTSASGSASNSRVWRRRLTTWSRIVTISDVGTSTLADPRCRVEGADGGAGFEQHPPVVARRLLDRPRLPLRALRCRYSWSVSHETGLLGGDPGERGEPARSEERQPFEPFDGEHRCRCAQHEPEHPLAVAAPDQLRDRATHRVADGDERVDARVRRRRRRRRRHSPRGGTASSSAARSRGRGGRRRRRGIARPARRSSGTS